jgi:hypothetical protein
MNIPKLARIFPKHEGENPFSQIGRYFYPSNKGLVSVPTCSS